MFSLQANKFHVRRRSGERLKPECVVGTVKHPVSVMVWGCFSHRGPGRLHIVPKGTTVTAAAYQEILENRMLPSARDMFHDQDYIFQDDGAPCHRAKSVKNWLSANDVGTIGDWPGQSPDINPIENLWNVMKLMVRNQGPKNRTELIEAVIYSWNHVVEKKTLQQLCDSMPRRLRAVINAKGNATKY